MKVLLLVVCTSLIQASWSYPTGANPAACVNLTPQHGVSAQTGETTYTVNVSSTTYTTGQAIVVTISSKCGDQFRGFLAEARRADTALDTAELLGAFTAVAGQSQLLASCTGSALTHVSGDLKTEIAFTWTAPAISSGHIVITVTFVEGATKFWVGVNSPVIEADGTAALLAAKVNALATATVGICPTAAPTGNLPSDPACASTKGCFQFCQDNECDFVLTWAPNGPNVDFELSVKVEAGNRWGAVGLSNDDKMGEDSVIACIADGGTVTLEQSYNPAQTNEEVLAQTGTLTGSSYANGILKCQFNIPTVSTDPKIFNLNDDYTLLLGTGAYDSATSVKGMHSTFPQASTEKADFQSTSQIIGGSSGFPLVKAHGCMMVLAWIFSASVGLVMARYFKPMWPNSKLCGEKVWFSLHRFFMMLTFFLCTIAFILIFVSTDGKYSQIAPPVYLIAHPILGIFVFILCIVNPIMAMLRPHPGTSRRPIFNWAHWGVGTLAEILAVITIFFGIDLPKASTPPVARWVLVAFVAHLVLVTLILEAQQCMTQKKNNTIKEEIEMKNKHSSEDNPIPAPPPSGSLLKSVILVYHVCASFGLALAVVIIIAVN